MDHQNDLLELIIIKDDNITSFIYTKDKYADAEKKLRQLYAPIRFDLHGVMDLLPINYPIKYPACIISFVGKYSHRRDEARKEIKERIKNNQIKFGILVFNRIGGTEYEINKRLLGTKAWINLHLSKCTKNKKSFFIDDSEDHIISTSKLNIPNLTTILVTDVNHLKEKINEIYKILDNENIQNVNNSRISSKNTNDEYYKYCKYKHKYIDLKNRLDLT